MHGLITSFRARSVFCGNDSFLMYILIALAVRLYSLRIVWAFEQKAQQGKKFDVDHIENQQKYRKNE